MATTKVTDVHKPGDPIAMLMADHKKVKSLFREFESLKNSNATTSKAELVRRICEELTLHATIEEEIFYPAVRAAIDADDLMDEALVEHGGAKELIAQLQAMQPKDALYDAKVTVLGEQIDHHVKEEEGQMFPKARRAKLDADAMGAEMAERKAALKAELSLSEGDSEEATNQSPRKRAGRVR
jgi:hemerythrin superfamily protein